MKDLHSVGQELESALVEAHELLPSGFSMKHGLLVRQGVLGEVPYALFEGRLPSTRESRIIAHNGFAAGFELSLLTFHRGTLEGMESVLENPNLRAAPVHDVRRGSLPPVPRSTLGGVESSQP